MEVIVVHDGHCLARKSTTHQTLGVLDVPWRTMEASDVIRVDQVGVVAWGLRLVVTFEDERVDEGLQGGSRSADVESLLFTEDNLVNELSHGLSSEEMSLGLSDIGLKITVFDSRWWHT